LNWRLAGFIHFITLLVPITVVSDDIEPVHGRHARAPSIGQTQSSAYRLLDEDARVVSRAMTRMKSLTMGSPEFLA